LISIDLNSDLGEHADSDLDERIMPFISSCNIACGGHAGDEMSVTKTVALAKKHDVAIGAHPSYPDKENFGRNPINISKKKLEKSLFDQILRVQNACGKIDIPFHHIKPHGALYNEAAKDKDLSELLCNVLKGIDPHLKLYGLAHSITEAVAKEHEIQFIPEGFADRQYEPDLTLRSRKKKGAVLSEKDIIRQVEGMVLHRRVDASGWVNIHVQTICLHSDTEGAVTLAEKIRKHLEECGVHIVSV